MDGIQWDIHPVPDRIIAVGDVHGDLRALASILLDRGIIDREGCWTGSDCHLVLVGDVMKGNEDCRLLMEFLLRLEVESELEGGGVHALLGNQDLPVNIREGIPRPLEHLFRPWGGSRPMRDEFPAMMRYACWLRRRNTILRLGETAFVHAGLGKWARYHDPGEVNATIRAWIAYWHGLGRKPDDRTGWMVGGGHATYGPSKGNGPLWGKSIKPLRIMKEVAPRPGAPSRRELGEIFDSWRVKRVVVGHYPVEKSKWMTTHPYYDSMVCMIDTGISKKSGRLSCIEIDRNDIIPHMIKSSKHSVKVRRAEKLRLRECRSNITRFEEMSILERGRESVNSPSPIEFLNPALDLQAISSLFPHRFSMEEVATEP